jgi:hypothetical protein
MKLLAQYYRLSQVAGVNIRLGQDGAVEINCCSVSTNNNQLTIDKKLTGISDIEALARTLPSKTAVALNLSGKGVLYKQFEKVTVIDQGNFNLLLPNGNIDDFYVQQFDSGEASFIAIVRKSEADKWIGRLKAIGLLPLSLSLGPFPVDTVMPQLNVYGNEWQFDGNSIQQDDKQHWINYRHNETFRSQFAIKIGAEVMDEKILVSYAAAFQLVMAGQLDSIEANVPVLSEDLLAKLNSLKLKANGAIMLSVLFILLLFNFLAFSMLDSSNARLSAQVSRFTRTNSSARDLDEQIKKKEDLLQSVGWDGGVNKSGLIDQLAALMPEEISLREVAVNPVDLNSTRAQRSLIFFNRRISITGTCARIIPVNEWIARIATRPWVKNVRLENYSFNNEVNTGQFTLILNY